MRWRWLIVVVTLALAGVAGWASAQVLTPGVAGPDGAEDAARVEPTGAPQLLLSADELLRVFSATRQPANPTYFGVYSVLPVGDSLYLGLGAARPAEYDGALLARLDMSPTGEQALQALAPLDEQGFVDMTLSNSRIYIPGADPTEEWTLGNLYIHDTQTGETVKRRTLPSVIHAWQVRVVAGGDGASGRLLVTVGRYLPERGTWPWAGGLLTSTDEGLTWTADDSPALGASRTYDLVKGPSLDVALVDDADISGCQLATRSTGGAWQHGAAWVLCRLRLASDPAGRRVLAVGVDGRSLIVAGSEQKIGLPFAVEPWAYHWQALGRRTLYVLANDGRVLATRDLRRWTTVTRLPGTLLSIAYWPERGALVVATRGTAGAVYLVPVGQ